MITIGTVKRSAHAILTEDEGLDRSMGGPTNEDIFGAAVAKHNAFGFKEMAKSVKDGNQVSDVLGYRTSLEVVGLFIAHQEMFMTCLDEIAEAEDQFAAAYMIELTEKDERSVTHAMSIFKDYSLFEYATPQMKAFCYEIIHDIVVHVVTKMVTAYNIQREHLDDESIF